LTNHYNQSNYITKVENSFQGIKNKNQTYTSESSTPKIVSRIITALLWLLFAANVACLFFFFPTIPEWRYENIFRGTGFTILIWTTVTFFGALVSTYASNYLKGFRYHAKFMVLCLAFTLAVMLFVVSNHVVLLLLSWLLMAIIMSRLIGVDAQWGEAREASKFTLKYFLIGTLFLTVGVLLLAIKSDMYTVSGIVSSIDELPIYILSIAAVCIIIAAIVQSAIYPFHRWLLSAMTAPTPGSALMHAGFVNGAGILLTLFSTVLFATNTLDLLFVIGGLTAIIAQFTKLLQVNVKQKLACSTIAQMGFMIMQCGLGFFNAAVAHLILHGFYKAYLFLASGEEIAHSRPKKAVHFRITPVQAIAVLGFGVLGAVFFAQLTEKGTTLDSSIFLTLIVAITVGQATYNIVKERSLSLVQKIFAPPVLFIAGVGCYALMYNGVTVLMADLPMVAVSLPLSVVQIIFGVIFLIGFFIMKLGIYKNVPWIYVKLMNISQPYKKSILFYKSKS
jgi:NAD(P)H-quinone oxidoreductase subunit 5